MSQKRKKRELVFTITAIVYTDFMEELIDKCVDGFVKGVSMWANTKGNATKITYEKNIKI